ncbi:uncharacterized protein HMPREF1541_02960 [Cyphellophora europaea CBS 101466]|uniref:Kelch repeat protein n=1 Tax=Cyphellophora europaea (strain CBS 101466) TaxID=1220924 RepID=W2RWZ9_CYPE1|nr:uncharacterized protein HMPREF1541_02960 [Cyphellophora europaea CBS 101466]ETN41026.1 hypothetical protein HMPREF1541_02960 [Cyphellophora europaea CBS 101466]
MRALLLLGLSVLTLAQNDQRICAWYRPRYGSVRDALYIDGGTILENGWQDGSWASSNPTQTYPSGVLYALNFSNTFEGLEPVDLRELLTELPLTAGGPYDAPDFSEGAMFTSDYELYTYGGLPRSDSSSSTILNYRLFPSEGQTIFSPGPRTGVDLDNDVSNYVTSGGWASAPSENKGWYFSGMRAASWGPLAQMASTDDVRAVTDLSNVLITADFTSPGSASWQNTTLPSDVRPRVNPELVWIPVAQQGVLLAIGGVLHHQKFGNYGLEDDQIEESEEISPSFMTQIPVYDIDGDEWYLQNTTGDAPDFRAEFCAVVAALPDDTSTYDIYIYGGDNGLPGSRAIYADDAVWVLSVPAFRWTRVSTGAFSHGRSGHSCATPFPNQMLVLGGQNLNSTTFCIQDGSVIDVFNLNTLEWTRKYSWDTYEDYRRPQIIIDAIDGAAGADSAVRALFDTTYTTVRNTWYPYTAGGSNDTNSGNGTDTTNVERSSTGGGTNAGAIAGGVVGGIAVLVIGFLIFWFCRPSRRAARKSRNSTTAYTETTLGASAVSRWLRRTNFNEPPQRQAGLKEGSETDATSNDDHIVPAANARPPTTLDGPAELYGDERAFHEMSTDDGFSPRSSTAVDNTTNRTRHTSVEAGSEPIHEMLDDSVVSPRQSAQVPSQPFVWKAEHRPFGSIDENSASGPLASLAAGVAGSNSAISHPGSTQSGSDRGAVSRTSVDQSSRPSISGPPPGHDIRPTLDRNESSISSELPTSPPSRHGSNLRMSANAAGPISPSLADVDRHAQAGGIVSATSGRPGYGRHGSSLVSAVSENEKAMLKDEKRVEGDRREARRILEGEKEEVMSPVAASALEERKSTAAEMSETPKEVRRVASSSSRFKEDLTTLGEAEK